MSRSQNHDRITYFEQRLQFIRRKLRKTTAQNSSRDLTDEGVVIQGLVNLCTEFDHDMISALYNWADNCLDGPERSKRSERLNKLVLLWGSVGVLMEDYNKRQRQWLMDLVHWSEPYFLYVPIKLGATQVVTNCIVDIENWLNITLEQCARSHATTCEHRSHHIKRLPQQTRQTTTSIHLWVDAIHSRRSISQYTTSIWMSAGSIKRSPFTTLRYS